MGVLEIMIIMTLLYITPMVIIAFKTDFFRWKITDGIYTVNAISPAISEKNNIKCIEENGENIHAATGEANYNIFTEAIVNALSNKKIVPKIIIGPVVSVNEERKSFLIEEAANNEVTLFKAKTRPTIHFRVSDKRVYIEKPHPPMAMKREFTLIDNSKREVKRYRKHFENLSKDSMQCLNPKNDFLFLTKESLKKINYSDTATYEELKKELDAKGIPYRYAEG